MGLLDSWADRLTGPAPTPPRRPLVAAGARVNLRSPSLVHTKHPAWQSDAWEYRDDVDEMRAAGDFVNNTLGRIRVFGAENRPRGEEPIPLERASQRGQKADDLGVDQHTIDCTVAAVERLAINEHGSSLLGRYAENLDYAGECYLLGRPGDDGEEWSIRSVSEVQVTQGGARLVEPGTGAAMTEIDAASSDLLRLWTPHPRYYEWPDAPVATLLNTLEGMRLIGRRGRAHDRSRISSGKVLYVPTDFSLVRPGHAPVKAELPGLNDAPDVDAFMENLVDYMTAAIADESDPSAVVPVVIRGPAMIGDRPAKEVLGTVDIHGEDPQGLDERYEALVMRFARGINLSPERVKGIGESTTNWTATAVTSDEIKVSVEPRAERMCDALTAAYLRPSLKAMGVPADQRRKVCLWFDSSELVEAPNRGEDAKAAHTAGAISDEALRRYLGMSEEDAPDNLEMLRRAVDRERLSPASVPILVKVLTGGMPTEEEAAQLVAPPVPPAPPGARPIIDATPRGGPERPATTPPVGQRAQPATAAPAGQLTAAAKRPGPQDDPTGPSVAGVALIDSVTGRVLMLQRGLDDADDPAAGTWEFPGGHVEPDDETSLHAGMREWEEEVGRPFPGTDPDSPVADAVDTWLSPDGVYRGHVVVLPGAEQLVDLDGPRTVANADDDYSEQSAWWDLDMARRMGPALRPEVKAGTPWGALKKAVHEHAPTVAAGRDSGGRSASPDHVRRWRLDRAGSRRLMEIDRDFTDRLLAHSEASVGRAVERAANRLRALAQKDAERAPYFREPHLPKGADPRGVVAQHGRYFAAAAPDEDLLADAFAELEQRFYDEADRAATAVEETVAAMLAPAAAVAASAVTAASMRGLRDRLLENARDTWSRLKETLREHAERVLYGEYTPTRDGEASPGIVPASIVREAAAYFGGMRYSVDDDGRKVDDPEAKRPATGPGTGEIALERLRVSGAAEIGHEWVYPPTPRRHFLPHQKLDGLQFTAWDDPALDAGDNASWIGPHYSPGDHEGCLCYVMPYVAIPMTEDADPRGPELADLAASTIPPPTTAAGWSEDLHPRGPGGRWIDSWLGGLDDAIRDASSSDESRYLTKGSDGQVWISKEPPGGPHYRVSPGGSLLRVDEGGHVRPVPPAARDAVARTLAGRTSPGSGDQPEGPRGDATRPPVRYAPPPLRGIDDLSTQPRQQAMRDAVDAVSRVHSTEGMPAVRAADMPANLDFQGMFAPNRGYGASTLHAGASNDLAGTMVHELGHAMDWESFGPPTGYLSESRERTPLAAAMVQFQGAASRSEALQAIRASAPGPDIGAGQGRYRDYMQRPREVWARAYHQYVVTKAGTPAMKQAMAKQQKRDAADNGLVPEQWSDEDFVPVAAAVERVLQAKGWL